MVLRASVGIYTIPESREWEGVVAGAKFASHPPLQHASCPLTIEKCSLIAQVARSHCTMLETPSKLRTEALKIGKFAGFAGNTAVAANP